MNKNYKIVTQNLTQRFVDHRNIGLTTQGVAELAFHHAKRGLDIAAFMVMPQELIAPELKVVIHLCPFPAAVPAMMGRKRNVRSRSNASNRICVVPTGISLVRRNLRNLEILRCRFDHRRQHLGIVSIPIMNLYSGNDVGFNSAHEMALHPIMLRDNSPVLVVIPASKPRRGKAGRIHGEIYLDRLKRQAVCVISP